MTNRKVRIPIPRLEVDSVLFASDRTCCKCRIAGRTVQVHHIDGDPANNAPENLAVLCLECHNETLVHGGFGRQLTADQIVFYRDDWHNKVIARRNHAERSAADERRTSSPLSEPERLAVLHKRAISDRTAMGRHPDRADREFPERDFEVKRRSFCKVLRTHLVDLNQRLNWSDAHFVPLDAEVETHLGARTTKRHSNLLLAIRSDRTSQAFLVLGDPGSGKSVALRKLAVELLDEVEQTGRVPIYINFKEWTKSREWTKDNPPLSEDLYSFIYDYLVSHLDLFAREFLHVYYRRMFEHGRFFLLLDSFDEIPAVIDAEESSWIIERLSGIISATLSGDTRGVVASRQFRRPRLATYSNTVFTIRPFSDFQISDMLRKSFLFREGILHTLFRDRPELVSIVRNPLAAELLRVYINEHEGFLPDNQLELYRSYLETRLRGSAGDIDRLGLNMSEIDRVGQEIAWLMFQTLGVGLEVPIAQLIKDLSGVHVGDIIKILVDARLARLGSLGNQSFSFVHRRFFEYFLARHFIANPELVDVDEIMQDSRARDALVLYCEVAKEPEAIAVAGACWAQIRVAMLTEGDQISLYGSEYLKAIHCLRFLSDAFRSRQACLGAFRDELATYADLAIRKGKNLLEMKHALEATGLLKPDDVESCVANALSLGAEWISETALRACRHLPRLGRHVAGSLGIYLSSVSSFELLRKRKELLFALNLSEAFAGLRRFCRIRVVDAIAVATGVVVLLVTQPLLAFIMLVFVGTLHAMGSLTQTVRRSEAIIENVRMAGVLSLAMTVWLLWSAGFAPLAPSPTSPSSSAAARVGATEAGSSEDRPVKDERVVLRNGRGEPNFLAKLLMSVAVYFWRIPAAFVRYSTPFMLFGVRGLRVLCGLDIFIGILMIPWPHLYAIRFTLQRAENPERTLRITGLALMVFAVIQGIFSLIPASKTPSSRPETEQFSWLSLIPLGILTLFVIVFPVKNLLQFLARLFGDWRLSLRAKASVPFDRESIEQTFRSFRTGWGREAYVEWLGQLPVCPRGMWVEGLPNAGNDRASQLLAQLEERWLGLER